MKAWRAADQESTAREICKFKVKDNQSKTTLVKSDLIEQL